MGLLEDVMKVLDRIPVWKRLQQIPAEHDALVARVADLERRLSGPTGLICPSCGEPKLMPVGSKPDETFGDFGVMSDSYQCSNCQHQESRQRETLRR
jgi:hypothetical protein